MAGSYHRPLKRTLGPKSAAVPTWRFNVKAMGWMFAAALCAVAVPGAKADFWFDPAPGFGVPDVAPEDQGGPYFVAGFGDSIATPRKYWGGPYFVGLLWKRLSVRDLQY